MGCNISARQQSLITQDPRRANHSSSEVTDTTTGSPTNKKKVLKKGRKQIFFTIFSFQKTFLVKFRNF